MNTLRVTERADPSLDAPDRILPAELWDNVRPAQSSNALLAMLAGHHRLSRKVEAYTRFGVFGLLAVITLASIAYIVHFDVLGRFQRQMAEVGNRVGDHAGLDVAEVFISGRTYTDAAALRAAANIMRGDPILDVDLDAVRSRVERLSWVKTAEVERQLPDVIRIHIVERTPFALWQRNRRLSLVDDEGVVLASTNNGQFTDLPVVIGDEAPRAAASLFAVLASEPDLSARVEAAQLLNGRRWNLYLDNGIEVRLPADAPEGAWIRLGTLERDHQILARDIVAIDLRLDDRLVVELPDTALRPAGVVAQSDI